MSLWHKLFKKRKHETEKEDDWEQIVYARDEVNFDAEEERSRYITNCLEQIAEASKEVDLLTGEYSLVTSYLTDIEEIEALPHGEREKVNKLANRLAALEAEREQFRDRKRLLSDVEYYQLRKQEDEIAQGIEKIRQEEKYNGLVKQDLKRLDRERHAYSYRREELDTMLVNLRGMAVIFLSALVVCLLLLAILQFGFRMHTEVGFFLSLVAAAIAISVLCVKYMDANKEAAKVENAINRLIQLQNKVKIRYVNNVNLLDYLYMKYNTDSGKTLERRWENYQQEKEYRKQFAETEAKADYYGRQLVDKLSNYHLSDPSRWIHQSKALLDKREMVEIRHELILRRQALRKQMDYNKDVAETAKKEIMDVVGQYPAYANEIMDMVNRYEK